MRIAMDTNKNDLQPFFRVQKEFHRPKLNIMSGGWTDFFNFTKAVWMRFPTAMWKHLVTSWRQTGVMTGRWSRPRSRCFCILKIFLHKKILFAGRTLGTSIGLLVQTIFFMIHRWNATQSTHRCFWYPASYHYKRYRTAKFFYDDLGRDNFLERLRVILRQTGTPYSGKKDKISSTHSKSSGSRGQKIAEDQRLILLEQINQ